MGGEDRVARQRELGKLPVRERIDLLRRRRARSSSTGMLADHMDPSLADRGSLAADGVVTGVGEIDGRRVAIIAYDFTVMAGSMGQVGEQKTARIRELVLRQRIPIVWLLDSGGARIQSTSGSTFAGTGALFREQVTLSGVVPQVGALLGHCAAGTAYIPALTDFIPMVKGTSSMALGGRHLVKAATGEDVTEEEMGGSEVHTKVSGVADQEVGERRGVPRHGAALPVVLPEQQRASSRRSSRPTTRSTVVVRSSTTSCRPRRGGPTTCARSSRRSSTTATYFEMKPQWARNIVTALARVGGQPVGIVANQPMVLGGALDVNAADKAARFVWLCDAFNIPLVFLHDVPGFIVGSAVEKQGIIRHGAKMLFAVSEATVPKVSVVLRKSYGAGYFVMNGLAYEADYLAIWPTAEIAVMGPDGMVNITMRKQLEQIPKATERDEARIAMAEEFRKNIDPYIAAGHAQVDDVIDPADTRLAIWRGLQVSATKTVQRPWRKHGVLPV